jgi:predicted Zn finger-like uncharacterized protein
MFKVVADQLKVSDGWVRCGHCDDVFDASAHLQVTEAALQPKLPELTERVDVALPAAITPQRSSPSYFDDASISAPLSSYLSVPDAADASLHHEPARSQNSVESRALDGSHAGSSASASLKSFKTVKAVKSVNTDEARRLSLSDLPLVHSAQRRDQPQHALRRVLSALLAFVLLATLVLQVLLFERDALAARFPAWLPALQTMCQAMDCQIKPPRVMDAIVIESSSFTQTGPDTYRLNVVLQNTRQAVVALPALELTLTGSQNDVLLRKVLLPSDLGVNLNRLEQAAPFVGVFNLSISPSAASIAAALDAQAPSAMPITGYRLFAFYP